MASAACENWVETASNWVHEGTVLINSTAAKNNRAKRRDGRSVLQNDIIGNPKQILNRDAAQMTKAGQFVQPLPCDPAGKYASEFVTNRRLDRPRTVQHAVSAASGDAEEA